jgi:hypothetical protein
VAEEFVVVGDGMRFDFEQYEKAARGYGMVILNKMESLAREGGVTIESGIIENTETPVLLVRGKN